MRFHYTFLFTLTLSTFTQIQDAKAGMEDPGNRGLVVSVVTALSVAGGAIAGFSGGVAIGSDLGGDNAFYPLALATFGGIVSAATAAPVGAFVAANYTGANKGLVTINTTIVAGLGAAGTISGIVDSH